jgi:anti-repressor protein
MNQQLIPISKSKHGRDVVSAQTLHQFLEVGTRFDMWFARRVEEYLFVQGVDYQGPILGTNSGADYVITLDMAKELSMVERNEKGQQARRYFIECEKQLRGVVEGPRPALPTSYKEALTALLAEVEQKEKLEQQLALAAPKLAFVQSIEASSNALTFAAAAKWLKIPGMEGRNKLVARLKADGLLMQNREPYQQYLNQGLFQVQPQTYQPGKKEEKGTKGERLTNSTRVTPKGLEWLSKRYKQAA